MQVKSIAEHSAILSTFIKLRFVIKIFVLSIFEWLFYTGFSVNTKKRTTSRGTHMPTLVQQEQTINQQQQNHCLTTESSGCGLHYYYQNLVLLSEYVIVINSGYSCINLIVLFSRLWTWESPCIFTHSVPTLVWQ